MTSSLTISHSSLANSTPVGPPPQTTKLSKRLRSSISVLGSAAFSRLSMMRLRMACASGTVLSWKQLSSPGTPCVLLVDPHAMTSLSYGT